MLQLLTGLNGFAFSNGSAFGLGGTSSTSSTKILTLLALATLSVERGFSVPDAVGQHFHSDFSAPIFLLLN